MITNTNDYLVNFGKLLEYSKLNRRNINLKNCAKYGLRILDEYLGGILPSELVVVGAHTGCGKSELAYNISITNALRGKKVLLLALEGDIEEVANRYTQKEINKIVEINNVNYRFNLDTDIYEIEDKVIEETRGSLKNNLLVFNKKEVPSLKFVRELIETMKDQVDMIVIDHLHYIHTLSDNENMEIGRIMRELKTITDIVKKPIILMSHLRKPLKTSDDPTVYDLYGSSNVSKEATTILLITPIDINSIGMEISNKYLNNNRYSGTKIILAKSRIGLPKSSFGLVYDRIGKQYIDKLQYIIHNESGLNENDKIIF